MPPTPGLGFPPVIFYDSAHHGKYTVDSTSIVRQQKTQFREYRTDQARFQGLVARMTKHMHHGQVMQSESEESKLLHKPENTHHRSDRADGLGAGSRSWCKEDTCQSTPP